MSNFSIVEDLKTMLKLSRFREPKHFLPKSTKTQFLPKTEVIAEAH